MSPTNTRWPLAGLVAGALCVALSAPPALADTKDDKSDSLDSIAAIGDGFVMAGSTESKGAGRKDGWIVRVDGDGNTLWDKPLGEQFDNEFTALAAMPDGGVLVGGSTAQKVEAPPAPPQPTPARPQRTPPPKPELAQAKLWLMRLGYP